MQRNLIFGAVLCGVVVAAGVGFQDSTLPSNRSSAAQAEAKERPTENTIGMKFVLIPPGKFVMGSPETELHRNKDEAQHEVAITKPFYLSVYEVTQREYVKIMGKNPSFFSATGPGKQRVQTLDPADNPVDRVSWSDAVQFCKTLGVKEDKRYRLPTEAEWEYACRAGTKTVFHTGNTFNSNLANINGLSYSSYGEEQAGPFYRSTIHVGQFKANAFGLHDMHGNVQEWCADWYDDEYYAQSPKEDPQGPAEGMERVLRGGAWPSSAKACRSAARNHLPPEDKTYTCGFRVVLQAK